MISFTSQRHFRLVAGIWPRLDESDEDGRQHEHFGEEWKKLKKANTELGFIPDEHVREEGLRLESSDGNAQVSDFQLRW
jgi:hypothetical protein